MQIASERNVKLLIDHNSDDVVIAEIVTTMRAIREVIGVTPTLLRPPYGDIDPRVRSIAKALGLHVVIW